MGLQQVCDPLQVGRPLVHRRGLPARVGALGAGQRGLQVLFIGVQHLADGAPMVCRIVHGAGRTPLVLPVHDGCGPPALSGAGPQGLGQAAQRGLVREVQPLGVAPPGGIEVRWQGDARVGFVLEATQADDGVGDDALDGHRGVRDAVDERGVGAVLQQAAHQVGQQLPMPAAGGIDSTRCGWTQDLTVQGLAHAVQALELQIPALAAQL